MANSAKLDVLGDGQKESEALNAEDVGKQFNVFDVVLEFWWQFDAIGDDLWRSAASGFALECRNVARGTKFSQFAAD